MSDLPANLSKQTVEVRHSGLERAGDSAYKSECPVCEKGILHITRDETLRIVRTDICCLCGQTFRYSDRTINGEVVWDDAVTRPAC